MIDDFSVRIKNPLFSGRELPSLFTLPVNLPLDSTNQKLLDYVDFNGHVSQKKEIDYDLKIKGLAWKKGILKVLSGSESSIKAQFVSDAGAVKSLLQGKHLRQLDLGTVSFSDSCVDGNLDYVCPEINNDEAFAEDSTVAYNGVINSYSSTYTGSVVSPYVKVSVVLEAIAKVCDYKLIGAFISDAEFLKLAIYTNRIVDTSKGFKLANQLPKLKISEFLIELGRAFGVSFYFDTKAKVIEVLTYDELLSGKIEDWTSKVVKRKSWKPNAWKGLKFHMVFDSSDSLHDNKESNFRDYEVEEGGEEWETKVNSLVVINDDLTVKQAVFDADKEEGTQTNSFRLVRYEGLTNNKPLASALSWDGSGGLVAQGFDKYVSFRKQEKEVTYEMTLDVSDLFNFHPKKRVRIGGNVYVIAEVRARVRKGAEKLKADVKLRRCDV